MTVDPISEADARELADEYNRNVLRRAGVPISDDEVDPTPTPEPVAPAKPAPPPPGKTWAFGFPTQGGARPRPRRHVLIGRPAQGRGQVAAGGQ